MVALIAGATGFVGRKLAVALIEDGFEVRAVVRDRDRDAGLEEAGCSLVEADLTTDDVGAGLAGVDVAYFLVHMIGRVDDWASQEQLAAGRFARAASAAGVARIAYLGGLGGDEGGSVHLRSRHATAEVLAAEGPPLTYFRAAMVVGAGSESYELLKAIAERLPAIPEADWLRSRTQPIGARDVISYLREAPSVSASSGREVQIGGPDVLTHLEVVEAMAQELGHRPPWMARVPGATPEAVAAGAAAVTTGDQDVAAAITRGLAADSVVTDRSGMDLFQVEPEPFSVALQRAIEEEREIAR